jgi:hypothetical protein
VEEAETLRAAVRAGLETARVDGDGSEADDERQPDRALAR